MNRQQLELAISELNRLLVDLTSRENQFQKWFEDHPVIFQTLGYHRVIVQPNLQVLNKTFIPDFLVQRVDGLWEIFELKRPDTDVLRDKERRQVFYAAFEEYYSQCREYAAFFEDATDRETFNRANNLNVQKSLSSIIVAGRNNGLDRATIHNKLFDRGPKVSLMTFDDVRDSLEKQRANLYSKYEDKLGLSVHMVLIPKRCEKEANYILDFGIEQDRNRISIYINENDLLSFRIIDSEGQAFLNRVPKDANFNYNEISYFTFELALSSDYAVLIVEVNGCYFYDCNLPNLDLDVSPSNFILGSDVLGQANSKMDMIDLACYRRSLLFSEKYQLRDYYFSHYQMGAMAADLLPARASFSNHQFLHSEKHPNFSE